MRVRSRSAGPIHGLLDGAASHTLKVPNEEKPLKAHRPARVKRALAIAIGGSAFAVLGGHAADAADSTETTWTAISTTAMGITGDIVLAEDRITFANGESLVIAPVSGAAAGIFRVDPPQNPVLLQGNTLCGGRGPARFIVTARKEEAADLDASQNLYLKVFSGADVPPASTLLGSSSMAPGLCASFNYEREGS
jgi:hypothetical protein